MKLISYTFFKISVTNQLLIWFLVRYTALADNFLCIVLFAINSIEDVGSPKIMFIINHDRAVISGTVKVASYNDDNYNLERSAISLNSAFLSIHSS